VAHDSCFAWIVGRFKAYAPVVETDTFTYDSPDLGKEVRLMNAVARFRPQAKERILFAAHWDSRPWADKDPNPARRTRPILGANDGASGVAVLLEVARVLRKSGTPIGVDLAVFDGEDLGTEENPSGYFRGSSRYVEWMGEDRPIFVILLDMVGKKDLNLQWEANSREQASNIVDLVWQEAHELGMCTILWCYLRNSAFKTKDADYSLAADLTGQANHLGVTIEADIIKQKLPEVNGG